MVDKDVLTQEEIDALLTGVDDGVVDTDVDGGDGHQVSEFDLTNQDRIVRGRLPTVELVSERFARLVRTALPANLKVPVELGPGGVQVVKFSEYVDTLYVPTCLKLVRIHPFAGTCLLALDAKLIHRIVDRFFGGSGVVAAYEGSEFSQTEQRVIDRIMNLLLANLEAAWQDAFPISCEIVGEEINPGLVNVIGAGDAVMVCSFVLDLDDNGGELHIVFPYASLEPFKRVLDATSQPDMDAANSSWCFALEEALLDTEVPVRCLIGDAELRLRDLMRLQPGDVLDIDMQDLHQVCVGSLPIFTARLGDSRGKFALEFESLGQA